MAQQNSVSVPAPRTVRGAQSPQRSARGRTEASEGAHVLRASWRRHHSSGPSAYHASRHVGLVRRLASVDLPAHPAGAADVPCHSRPPGLVIDIPGESRACSRHVSRLCDAVQTTLACPVTLLTLVPLRYDWRATGYDDRKRGGRQGPRDHNCLRLHGAAPLSRSFPRGIAGWRDSERSTRRPT